MSDQTLFGDSDDPAHLDGFGPIPAELARELITDACTRQEKIWLRRLYTSPGTGELVAMDARTRCFPTGLARFIRLRDQVCRTPWCDAPIRHIDHAHDHHHGGPTTAVNGQGLCEACNHATQAPAWHARPSPSPSPGRPWTPDRDHHPHPPHLPHPTTRHRHHPSRPDPDRLRTDLLSRPSTGQGLGVSSSGPARLDSRQASREGPTMSVRRSLALALVAALVLAGCQDEPEPRFDPPSESSSPSDPATSDEPEAQTAEEFIREWVELGQRNAEHRRNRGVPGRFARLCSHASRTRAALTSIYNSGRFHPDRRASCRSTSARGQATTIFELKVDRRQPATARRPMAPIESYPGGVTDVPVGRRNAERRLGSHGRGRAVMRAPCPSCSSR